MASQTVAHAREPVRTEGYLDVLQMLSGVALILFMWSHMILVSSINLGPGVLNAIANFLERYYLAQTGGPAIALIFLVHFVLVCRKLPFQASQQKKMAEHTVRFNHLDTWLWIVQALTAMIILIMGATHMWTILSDLPISAAKSAARIQGGYWLVFYMVLLPLIELHVGIGFYRIGVKWGFITRKDRGFWKGIENKITLGFLAIGVISLFTFYFLINANPS